MTESNNSVILGGGESTPDALSKIRAGVAVALTQKGLPGAFSLDLEHAGVKGLTGQIHLKPIVGKGGRVMYNIVNSSEITIGDVKLRPTGNMMLPKAGFTVDAKTYNAYTAAKAERDAKNPRKAATAKTEAEINALDEAGETTE